MVCSDLLCSLGFWFPHRFYKLCASALRFSVWVLFLAFGLLRKPWRNVFCFRFSQLTLGFLVNHTPSHKNARYDTDFPCVCACLFHCISSRPWLDNYHTLSCYRVVWLCNFGLFWIYGTTLKMWSLLLPQLRFPESKGETVCGLTTEGERTIILFVCNLMNHWTYLMNFSWRIHPSLNGSITFT